MQTKVKRLVHDYVEHFGQYSLILQDFMIIKCNLI